MIDENWNKITQCCQSLKDVNCRVNMISEEKYVEAQNSVAVNIQYRYDRWLIIVLSINIFLKETINTRNNKKDKTLNNKWVTEIECFEIKRVERI